MRWKILQFIVFFGVIASDIEYRWSNNGYATWFLAGFAAYAASCLVYSVLNWRTELVPLRFHKRQEDCPPLSGIGAKRLR